MKSRYILAGIMLTALAAGMLSGCGKKQEEESQTVSIVYESRNEENNSGAAGGNKEESKDDVSETKDTENSNTNQGSGQQDSESSDIQGEAGNEVLPSDFPDDVIIPDEEGSTAGNVGMGSNTVIVDNKDTAEVELQLDDEDMMMLENMNFYVPLFTEDTVRDEAFQKEILKYGFIDTVNGGERVTLEDGSGNQIQGYKVAEDVAASYYQNLLGEELTIQPEKPQTFGEETPVYYEGGYYYIGVMPAQGVGYMYRRTYQIEDTVYVAFIIFDDYDTYRDYVFALEWADNDNGFIVKAHYYDEQ